MPLRRLVVAIAFVSMVGCGSAPRRWSPAAHAAPDPDRWDRALCGIGAYPAEIDARALAWARWDDLRARASGVPSLNAEARVLDEREAFDSRCTAWRAAATGALTVGASAQADFGR